MESVLTVVGWMLFGGFVTLVGWAIGSTDEYSRREVHHDGKPGSHYFDSHNKGDK